MAITDNSFTGAELAAAVTANPALLNEVIPTLSGAKYVVRSEAEDREFLTNYENKVIGNKTQEHASAIEKDVFELTGIPKDPSEKYYDYQKRAVKTVKDNLEKATADLKAAREAGGASAADAARIAKLEKAFEDANAEMALKLGEKDTELNRIKVGSTIEKVLANLRTKYKEGMDAEIIETVESARVGSLLARAEMRKDSAGNDIVVFLDEKGEIREDPTTLKPLSAEKLLTEALKSLIDPGRVARGTGTNPDEAQPGAPKPGEFKSVPADVKTQVQFNEYLGKIGMIEGTPEYNKIWADHGEKMPLR